MSFSEGMSFKAEDDEETEFLSKMSKSCDVCKLRKVRCDGIKPRCSNCIRNGKECNYSLMKKPGLRNGYGKKLNVQLSQLEHSNGEILNLVKDLASRVEELENEQMNKRQKVNPGVILSSSTGSSSNADVSPLIMFPPLPQSQLSVQLIQPTHILGSMTSSSTTSSHPHQALALPSLLNPPNDTNNTGTNGRKLADLLPSHDIMQKLYDLYFENVNPIFPILHPKTTHDQIFKSRETCFISYGVVLLSLKYLDYGLLFRNNDERSRFYKSIKEKILLNCFNVSNLDKLTTMLLLTFESLGQSNDEETWSLVSIICSGLIHLDLISEVPSQIGVETPGSVNSTSSNPVKSISTRTLKLLKKPKNFLEEESRRRVFWCIYILDRIISVISSTPLKIPDSVITCSFPLDTNKWLNGEKLAVLDSFGFSIQLIKIFGATHEFNKMIVDITNFEDCERWFTKFREIEIELKRFVDSLPLKYSSLLINNDTSHLEIVEYFDILLHVVYNITMIKLHSPLGYPHNESEFFKRSNDSRIICSNCCNNVLHIIAKVGDIQMLAKVGPLYSIFLWIVTRVIIVEQVMGQGDTDITIVETPRLKFKLDKILSILDKVGDQWDILKKYCKIIRYLSNLRIKLQNKHQIDDEEDEEDSDDPVVKREPRDIISDMRLNTYYVSLALTTQIEERERELRNGGITNEFNGTNLPASQFQLDLNSYGFEDFFKYLGDINEVQ